MSAYLKVLELHVYLATTKKSYVGNDKYLEASAQAINALKHTLSEEHIFLISQCDSAFTVWSTLTSLKKQPSNYLEREPIRDEFEQACYVVQENDSLEVTLKSHLDVYVNSSDDHDSSMDAHSLNEELSEFCENLLSKYKILKNKSFDLKKENEILFLSSTWFLKKRLRF